MASLTAAPTGSSPPIAIRLASEDDVPAIDWLDTFGSSPHRQISRQVERYFGSVDPSIHERNIIFLAEAQQQHGSALPFVAVGKVELLLAPENEPADVGYIKRVVVHPDWRGRGVARTLFAFVQAFAQEQGLRSLDLHVWEGNTDALHLYESMGFAQRHRELYLRLTLPEPERPTAVAERKITDDDTHEP